MAKRQSALEDLIGIVARQPWWVGVLLALLSFIAMHLLAGMAITPPKNLQGLGSSGLQNVAKILGTIAQYVLPVVFLIGSAISALWQLNRGHLPSRSTGTFDDYLRGNDKVADKVPSADPWPAKQEERLEPTWDSDSLDANPGAKVDITRWNGELLTVLEWKRFEEVCAGLFERLGFKTKMFASGADGGVDIRLYQPPSNLPVAIVQCKAWTRKVGVNVVRELRGVMAAEGVAEGIFSTTSTYSDDAIAFAGANHIDLLDGNKVLDTILKLPEEQQASLLRLATAGDYTTPTCASCGVKLVLRTPARSKPFWGCVNYPRCKMIINIAGA